MAEKTFESAPGMLPIYAKAALRALPGSGLLPGLGGGKDIPDLELELTSAVADQDRLSAYRKVCGLAASDLLPATYPHILAFPLQMTLMTDGSFPFPAVGLVHIANRITQHRPIGAGEELALRVSATKLEPHPKGRQFSVLTEARVGDELVWEETGTELRRGGGSGEGGSSEADIERALGLPAIDEWKLASDLGRRYAAVSGDRNPIHMHDLAAKPFGYKRAIIHGMWTKARCLAALEGSLPDSFTVEVAFKRPLFLPATVSFASAKSDGGTEFAVRDTAGESLHLTGSLG